MKKETLRKAKGVILSIVISFVFFMGLIFFNNGDQTSLARCSYERNITSVLICDGDTLWDIAKRYYDIDLDGNFKDYVKEIYTMNQLDSFTIHAGNYIIVPYYVVENKIS